MKRYDAYAWIGRGQQVCYWGKLADSGREVFRGRADGLFSVVAYPNEMERLPGGLSFHFMSDGHTVVTVPLGAWSDSNPQVEDDMAITALYGDPCDVFYEGTSERKWFLRGWTNKEGKTLKDLIQLVPMQKP